MIAISIKCQNYIIKLIEYPIPAATATATAEGPPARRPAPEGPLDF